MGLVWVVCWVFFSPTPNEYCKFRGLEEMTPARADRGLQKHFVTRCSHHVLLNSPIKPGSRLWTARLFKAPADGLAFQVMEMPLSLQCLNVPNTLSIGM